MLDQLDDKQYRFEQMADHLIDRDDYFALPNPEEFLEWGYDNMTNFYDAHTEDGVWIEDFDIDGMFTYWITFVRISVFE